jgi:hypothetical protein
VKNFRSKVIPDGCVGSGWRGHTSFTLELVELAPPNQRLQAELAITLLEPDLLAWANIPSLFPRIFLQRLVLIAVGTEPQRNPIPLAIRFRKRDRHIADSPIRWGATDEVHQRSAANYTTLLPTPSLVCAGNVARLHAQSWLWSRGALYFGVFTTETVLNVTTTNCWFSMIWISMVF